VGIEPCSCDLLTFLLAGSVLLLDSAWDLPHCCE